MFRSTSDNWGTINGGRGAVMESLENRQFFSASAFESVAMTDPMPEYSYARPAAIEQGLHHDDGMAAPGAKAKKKLQKTKKADKNDKADKGEKSQKNKKKSNNAEKTKKSKRSKSTEFNTATLITHKTTEPTLAGEWIGTAIIDKGNVVVEMSAELSEGSGKVVSGTIKMGAVMGNKPIKSNMIIDPYNNCRMVLSGNGSVGGLTAAASPDCNSIVGRWTWNVKGLWVTGTFKLTKVA